jgi:hypothetical protein
MIQEDYVSFEIAKLLKEKGFEECPLFRYDDCGHLWVQGGYNKTIKWHFPAPTLQMAMKWLREIHNLQIQIAPITSRHKDWTFGIYKKFSPLTIDLLHFPTYEQACEAAIKYCLKNLI